MTTKNNVIINVPVNCPKCGAILYSWNGTNIMSMLSRCKKCGTYSFFDSKKRKSTIAQPPKRSTSSGCRFY